MARLSEVSLEDRAFQAIPEAQFVKFMSEVWQSPLRHQYWDKFKSNLSLEEMSRLAKLLPWDDPAARDLDLTVHKRRMHGKLIFFYSLSFPARDQFGLIHFQIFTSSMVALPFSFPCCGIKHGRSKPSLSLNGGLAPEPFFVLFPVLFSLYTLALMLFKSWRIIN